MLLAKPEMILTALAEAAPASLLPDPNSPYVVGWMFIGIVGLLTLINQGYEVAEKFRGRGRVTTLEPSPLEVRAATEYVLRRDYDQAIARLEEQHQQLDGYVRQDMVQLREKIISMGNDLAALKSTNLDQNRQLIAISAKLDRWLERQADHGN